MNWNILKKAIIGLIVSCVLITSMPSFSIKSYALEAVSSEALTQMIGYLMGYTASRGYDISKNLHFNKDLFDETLSYDIKYQFLKSYFDILSSSSEVYSNELKSALNRAVKSGVFSISEDLDTWLSNFYESLTVNDSLVLGTSTLRFEPYSESEMVNLGVTYIDTQIVNSPIYSVSTVIDLDYDYLPLLNYDYNNDGSLSSIMFIFLPTVAITSWNAIQTHKSNSSISNINNGSNYSLTIDAGSINSQYYYLFARYTLNRRYPFQSFNHGDYLTSTSDVLGTLLPSINAHLLQEGYYDSTSDFVSTRIHDTSNEDILSSASEIDPTSGEKSGGFTMYMRDWSLYQQLLRQFSENMISWNTLIKQLGLSSVSKSATVEAKQSAQDKVAYPDSTYEWFSSTTWGETITQSTTDSITDTKSEEDSIAEEVGDTLKNGQEPSQDQNDKSKGKGILAALLIALGLWSTPMIASDDPEAGGTPGSSGDHPEYLPESIAGIGVAGSLLDDIFDSAGGSNGYGLVYTIGASFVIFSVLIGASNYFGALFHGSDTKQNIKNSDKRSKGHKTNWNSNW